MTEAILWGVLVAAGVFGTYMGHRRARGVVVVKTAFPLVALLLVVRAGGAVAGSVAFSRLVGGFGVALAAAAVADFLLAPVDNSKTFVAGLAAFLISYAVYAGTLLVAAVTEHSLGIGVWVPWILGALFILSAVSLMQYRRLTAIPEQLAGAVRLYMVVVTLLVAAAFGYLFAPITAAAYAAAAGHTPTDAQWLRRALIMIGAGCIYLSDSLIAHNLFRKPLRNEELWIMPTYYLGQMAMVAALFA